MSACDPHCYVNDLDEITLHRLVDRLESRAKDAVFSRLIQKYITRLKLPPFARVLEVGCGTGVNLREIAGVVGFKGELLGVDQCQTFIEAARVFARENGLGDQIQFQVGDAHNLDFPSNAFDAVISHTVISHVVDPVRVMREMARVVRHDGMMIIFDGDYVSLTYSYPDYDFGRYMDRALARATFKNPEIMRDLPRLFPDLGLKLVTAWADVVSEIGCGSYFKSFAETYVPFVIKANLLQRAEVEQWELEQKKAMEEGKFFASCNYYTYMVRRI